MALPSFRLKIIGACTPDHPFFADTTQIASAHAQTWAEGRWSCHQSSFYFEIFLKVAGHMPAGCRAALLPLQHSAPFAGLLAISTPEGVRATKPVLSQEKSPLPTNATQQVFVDEIDKGRLHLHDSAHARMAGLAPIPDHYAPIFF